MWRTMDVFTVNQGVYLITRILPHNDMHMISLSSHDIISLSLSEVINNF